MVMNGGLPHLVVTGFTEYLILGTNHVHVQRSRRQEHLHRRAGLMEVGDSGITASLVRNALRGVGIESRDLREGQHGKCLWIEYDDRPGTGARRLYRPLQLTLGEILQTEVEGEAHIHRFGREACALRRDRAAERVPFLYDFGRFPT